MDTETDSFGELYSLSNMAILGIYIFVKCSVVETILSYQIWTKMDKNRRIKHKIWV